MSYQPWKDMKGHSIHITKWKKPKMARAMSQLYDIQQKVQL